jgi:integration host factor subunit beta
VNKSELAKVMAEDHNLSKDAAVMLVNVFFDSIREALVEDGRVEIRGFGSFKVKEYKGYKGRNPKTGESVKVSPKKLPVFRAGKELKELVNK